MTEIPDSTAPLSPDSASRDAARLDATQVRRSVAALADHLQRMGVGFFPKADPDSVDQWESAFAEASTPDGAAAAVSDLDSSPAVMVRESSSDTQSPPSVGASPVVPSPVVPSERLDTSSVPIGETSEPYTGNGHAADQRLPVLESLAQTVAGCVRCPVLVGCRTQTVFGEGSPTARFAFFGEGPGADEDRSGRPFVGKAGQLLTKMIEACTLSREEVYIFNTVKCRPPGNRNPELDEIANCREYFEKQLDVIRPEYIVCLGAVSMRALLGTTMSVGRMRGKFHDYRGSKVIVTYHPAYLLRTPAAKKAAWEDLQFLMADAGVDLSVKRET